MLASTHWWVNTTKAANAKSQGASRSIVNAFKLIFFALIIVNVFTAKFLREVERDEPCFKGTIT